MNGNKRQQPNRNHQRGAGYNEAVWVEHPPNTLGAKRRVVDRSFTPSDEEANRCDDGSDASCGNSPITCVVAAIVLVLGDGLVIFTKHQQLQELHLRTFMLLQLGEAATRHDVF